MLTSVTFQSKVSNAYTRQWLIFRGADGNFLDPNASFNATWCRGAVAEGRMLGWTMYVVYRPGMNGAVLKAVAGLGPFDRIMIDVESWAGQIRGDHSAEINDLVLDFAAIVGHSNVWVYGNTSDLAAIYPNRQPGQQLVIAAWGGTKPNVPNLIGWQYTDGAHSSPGRPLSSAPFGGCDHNELYVDQLSPSGGGSLIPTPGGDDLGTIDDTPQNEARVKQWVAEITMGSAGTGADLSLAVEGAPNPVQVFPWLMADRKVLGDSIGVVVAQNTQIIELLTSIKESLTPGAST